MRETISHIQSKLKRKYSNSGPRSRGGKLKVKVRDNVLTFKIATAVELKSIGDTEKVVLRVWGDDDFEDGAVVLGAFNFDAVQSWYWVD